MILHSDLVNMALIKTIDETKSSSSRIASPLSRGPAIVELNGGQLEPQSSSAAVSPRIISSFSTQSGLKSVDTRVAHHAKT